MDKKLHRFISSTVSYHNFQEAVDIASSLGCGIEISRFGKLSCIEENFEKNKKSASQKGESVIIYRSCPRGQDIKSALAELRKRTLKKVEKSS